MQDADVVLGLSAKGAFTTAMIRSMAAKPIIFAMANPDPEITPEEVEGDPQRRPDRHRPQRLSEPGQQRPGLPLHLPWRPRRARLDHQRRHEDRRRLCHRGPCARGRARRGQRRLRAACATAPIPDPDAVRSAPDHRRAGGRGQGRHRERRRPPADRQPRRYRQACAAGSTRPPAGCSRSSSASRRIPSAWSSPRARRRRASGQHWPGATAASARRS